MFFVPRLGGGLGVEVGCVDGRGKWKNARWQERGWERDARPVGKYGRVSVWDHFKSMRVRRQRQDGGDFRGISFFYHRSACIFTGYLSIYWVESRSGSTVVWQCVYGTEKEKSVVFLPPDFVGLIVLDWYRSVECDSAFRRRLKNGRNLACAACC